MEDAFWQGLKDIAKRRNRSLNDLVREIDEQRDGSLSSAIKVFVLRNLEIDR